MTSTANRVAVSNYRSFLDSVSIFLACSEDRNDSPSSRIEVTIYATRTALAVTIAVIAA